jgi:phage terminase large subunit-like protein
VGFDPDVAGPSPNRMDAFVFVIAELMIGGGSGVYV